MITKELAHTHTQICWPTYMSGRSSSQSTRYCDCVFHRHPFVLFKTQKNINTRGINTYRSVNWHTKASKPLFCIRDFHMCIFIISVTHLHMDEKGTRSNYPHIKEYQHSLTHLRSVACVEDSGKTTDKWKQYVEKDLNNGKRMTCKERSFFLAWKRVPQFNCARQYLVSHSVTPNIFL